MSLKEITFDNVFTFDHLMESADKCRRGVM